jgi:hypothetical protein
MNLEEDQPEATCFSLITTPQELARVDMIIITRILLVSEHGIYNIIGINLQLVINDIFYIYIYIYSLSDHFVIVIK